MLSHSPPSPPDTRPHFLLLGDSLVAGFDWHDRFAHFTIHNCGFPGATTRDLLDALPRLQALYPTARIVMVMIGTNDVLMENFSFPADLKRIIVELRRHYPLAELLVNSLLPMELPFLSTTAIVRTNEAIAAICRETGSFYIDIHERFLQADAPLFETDGVHLSPAGYEVWARTLLAHIAFLGEND